LSTNEARAAQGVLTPATSHPHVAASLVAFALLGAAVLFYFGELRALAAKWASSEELSHGFLVAMVVPVLFWLQRRALTLGRRGSPLAVAGLLAASAAWVLVRGANVDLVQWLLLPAILWFALWTALGTRSARALAFPVAYFLLAVPIWNLLLTDLFQWITVKASTLLLGLAGVQAYIEGAFVQVPAGHFEIAGGCSGMNYVIVAVATAALFSFIEDLSWRRSAVVVLVGVAIAMLANWIRVTYVIYDGNATNMQSPLVDDHATFGWYVFAVAMVPFFIIVRRVARGAPLPATATPATETTAGTGALPALVVGLAALGLGAAWGAVVDLRTAAEQPPELRMPALAGWEGPGLAEADWQPSFPGAAATRLVGYRRGDATVDAYAAFYARQSEAEKLIGYYSKVEGADAWQERGRSIVTLRDAQGATRAVREHLLEDAAGRGRLVWSWYEVRGVPVTGTLDVKLRESLRAFGLAPRSGIVALSAACVPDCDAARAVLTEAYAAGLARLSAGTGDEQRGAGDT
jgi:exosortase A